MVWKSLKISQNQVPQSFWTVSHPPNLVNMQHMSGEDFCTNCWSTRLMMSARLGRSQIGGANGSWRGCETRHGAERRAGAEGYDQLTADGTNWAPPPPQSGRYTADVHKPTDSSLLSRFQEANRYKNRLVGQRVASGRKRQEAGERFCSRQRARFVIFKTRSVCLQIWI